MRKKLDALLGRKTKAPKLKTLANLAISRITILKKQRQVRCSHARSDVVQLLSLGHQDRALLRVEHVIREQNMSDVYGMIENYCHLLVERVLLIESSRECPEELNEAISSLIFASSRCGEFPELQELREIFTSRFGKEFAARAVELRNHCRVNLKMTQKLSTTQTSLENRQKVLKQIASENGLTLYVEDDVYVTAEEKQEFNPVEKQVQPNEAGHLNEPELVNNTCNFSEDRILDEKFSESMKARRKYKDVADAAREAFESAAYAAAAARAAVELSRIELRDEDSDDHNSSNHKREISEDVNTRDKGWSFDKIHPNDSFCSESEGEYMAQNSRGRSHFKERESSNKKSGLGRTLSSSSSDTDTDNQNDREVNLNMYQSHQTLPSREEIIFDESDDETGKNQDSIPWLKQRHSGSGEKSNSHINKLHRTAKHNAVASGSHSDEKGYQFHSQSPKWKALNPQADPMTYYTEGRSRFGNARYANAETHLYSQHSHLDRKPTSMNTRQVFKG